MEKNITKLLIHISAADGYLSEVEIEKAYEELSNNYKITRNDFDSYVDEFFEETFSFQRLCLYKNYILLNQSFFFLTVNNQNQKKSNCMVYF